MICSLALARPLMLIVFRRGWFVGGVCVCVFGDYMITMIIHILCKSVAQLKQP